ncbi:hypothetical protein LAZ40_05475 [Cereibacter sphaeroides]|uniref:hypothetical protein n=1 Tax=Cereibacter sphaeroides TaxID=1063 RepID=UPI001F43648F|nr:hypothetical protein [Cereibacter sphaeroides]MCE6958499.1 hypothetical protein [Cereibacter sphaeroides]MCE6972839.1 hypothetical protein [Cereibacter sphaeroides]
MTTPLPLGLCLSLIIGDMQDEGLIDRHLEDECDPDLFAAVCERFTGILARRGLPFRNYEAIRNGQADPGGPLCLEDLPHEDDRWLVGWDWTRADVECTDPGVWSLNLRLPPMPASEFPDVLCSVRTAIEETYARPEWAIRANQGRLPATLLLGDGATRHEWCVDLAHC